MAIIAEGWLSADGRTRGYPIAAKTVTPKRNGDLIVVFECNFVGRPTEMAHFSYLIYGDGRSQRLHSDVSVVNGDSVSVTLTIKPMENDPELSYFVQMPLWKEETA